MPDSKQEQVLVIPTGRLHDAGLFQGLSRQVDHYLPKVLDANYLFFLPRAEAETDPDYKQIIPYVVFRWKNRIFQYQRGGKGNEARLRSLRSIGVGGHINPEDEGNLLDPYRQGMLREVEEEVHLQSNYREDCLGLINDDSTAVGQVHLGIVHVFDLEEPRVECREEGLINTGFVSLQELRQEKEQFETWSQFLLAEGVLGK